ncbi:peptidylprolyl isomerase [Aliikangiella sp. IMCC44359]|uniref:peptidylprolyl isomerase n=1 Tax=Aliikangiella sp. IMCC44359 TaxID=3459125 RepID=UPI00403AE7AE
MKKTKTPLKQMAGKAFLTLNLLAGSYAAQATIVEFQTVLGDFQVNLYDQKTPLTVANFLSYVNSNAYNNSIIHRSVNDFIVQGGGFAYDTAWPVTAIASNAAVKNEPVFSNVRGTIAMAKLANNPDSATNQWFFNIADNSGGNAQLDRQNSGFTVFGEVIGDGMAIVDQIVALNEYNLGGALNQIPLQNYTEGNDPNASNLVLITKIEVIDADPNTASALNPPLNTTPPPTPPSSSSGGGTISFLLLGLVGLLRKRFK